LVGTITDPIDKISGPLLNLIVVLPASLSSSLTFERLCWSIKNYALPAVDCPAASVSGRIP
jgi:hypothetical protein